MMRPWRTTRWNVRYAPVDDPALALIWQERIAWYPTPGRPPRRPRWWPLTLLVLAAIVLAALQAHPSIGHAQATNGNLKLLQEGLTSAGGAGSAATGRLTGALGEPLGGRATNSASVLLAGYQAAATRLPAGSRTITVDGTVSDSTATVTVNGIAATVSSGTYRATGVQLIEGPNTITVTATKGTLQSTKTIMVQLDTRPPARPAVNTPLALSSGTSYAISGTKTAGTTVWVNGQQLAVAADQTTWSTTVNLVEGDNVFTIITKDAAGNSSTANTSTIVLDNLPPVITVPSPAKTNLSPYLLTGSVDDSLTTVVVSGVTASRLGKTFEASVPLSMGANSLTITATSPNGRVSTKTVSVTRGAMPTISASNPADGSKAISGSSVSLQVTATDPEGDPIQYQALLDGQVLADWQSGPTFTWTPTDAQTGLRTLELRARDAFGGFAAKQAEVYVVYRSVAPQ